MGKANQGKYTEDKTREVLQALEETTPHFTFNRCLDAHAAGGRFPAQPGDFQAFRKRLDGLVSRNWIIECKEVQRANHLAPRLPYANFSPDGFARFKVRMLSGSVGLVVVCYRDPALPRDPRFQVIPGSVFAGRDLTVGSWDLSAHAVFTLKHFKTWLPSLLTV